MGNKTICTYIWNKWTWHYYRTFFPQKCLIWNCKLYLQTEHKMSSSCVWGYFLFFLDKNAYLVVLVYMYLPTFQPIPGLWLLPQGVHPAAEWRDQVYTWPWHPQGGWWQQDDVSTLLWHMVVHESDTVFKEIRTLKGICVMPLLMKAKHSIWKCMNCQVSSCYIVAYKSKT